MDRRGRMGGARSGWCCCAFRCGPKNVLGWCECQCHRRQWRSGPGPVVVAALFTDGAVHLSHGIRCYADATQRPIILRDDCCNWVVSRLRRSLLAAILRSNELDSSYSSSVIAGRVKQISHPPGGLGHGLRHLGLPSSLAASLGGFHA
jgi:hypothetical protein